MAKFHCSINLCRDRRADLPTIQSTRGSLITKTRSESQWKKTQYQQITRQDGKEITVALNDDGELICDIRRVGDAWLLVATDADSDEDFVVGVYFDRDEAYDAMEAAETTGLIPYQKISAAEYLRATYDNFTPATAREVKGITALEYLNETDE